MPTTTLAELRERVRLKVDMVGSDFVEDPELDGMINRAIFALDDKLHESRKDYFLVEEDVTLSGQSHELPPAFYKLVGVDVQSSNGDWVALHPFEWGERNALRNLRNARPEEMRYRLLGGTDGVQVLSFLPGFSAPAAARLSYYPQRESLINPTDAVTYPQAWEEWAVLRAAIEARTKEERDTASLVGLLRLEEARINTSVPVRDVVEPVRMVAPGEPVRRIRSSRR